MKITEKDNSFELSIAGYEYPNALAEPYDSNWLIIKISVSTSQGAWNVTDPCLLTYEASHLADWLEKINSGNFREVECGFLEPVVSFNVIDDNGKKLLRIRFMLEALPDWAHGQDEYSIEFTLSELNLKSASENLRKQLEKYPQRAAS